MADSNSNKTEEPYKRCGIHQDTPYGFRWGPIIVERASSDQKHGVWLHIRTGKQLLTVRATPSGLLRVSDIEKDWHHD